MSLDYRQKCSNLLRNHFWTSIRSQCLWMIEKSFSFTYPSFQNFNTNPVSLDDWEKFSFTYAVISELQYQASVFGWLRKVLLHLAIISELQYQSHCLWWKMLLNKVIIEKCSHSLSNHFRTTKPSQCPWITDKSALIYLAIISELQYQAIVSGWLRKVLLHVAIISELQYQASVFGERCFQTN